MDMKDSYMVLSYIQMISITKILSQLQIQAVQVSDDITITAFTPREKLNGVDLDKTWDMVRSHRNRELSNSDGKVTEDMPDALKQSGKLIVNS